MMASDFIVDVSEADFEYQVLAYSQEVPVVVDFWATWCAPCRVLGPLLERLANEARGGFRLAKVNVDENPSLANRYQVRSIPVVKAFRDGKIIAEFLGALPEPRVREFLRGIVPSEIDLLLEKGHSLLKMSQPKNAEAVFRQVLQTAPENPAALLGLAKSILLQGRGGEGKSLLTNFPASREFSTAQILQPLAEALAQIENNIPESDDPLDAMFYHSVRLIKRGNVEAALDGLLEVLRQNKRYRNGEVRQVILGLVELLVDETLARQYRNELASVLF